MKLKRLLALTLATALLFTACSSGDDADTTGEDTMEAIVTEITEPVEITFWHAMNGAQEEALTKMTDDFMAANPNITVTLQNQSSYGDLSTKLTSTMQSPEDLPTLTQAYPGWVYYPMEDGLVVDLKPYIEHETIGFDNYDDVLEGFRTAVDYDGKIYAMPFNKSTELLWYNKTVIVDELGLDVPTTYEELMEVSKEVYAQKGMAGVSFDSLSNYYTTYLANNATEYTPEFDVTSELSQEAVNYYLDGVKEGYFRIAGVDRYNSVPFGAETLAMYIGSSAGETYVRDGAEGKFEFGVAPAPYETVVQQGTDVYMFTSASPEQRTAAFEYLKHLTTTENQIYWAVNTGYIPVRSSALQSDEYLNSGAAVPTVIEEATMSVFSTPLYEGSDAAYNEIETVLEGLLALPEEADVPTALDNFKAILETTW